MRTLQDLYHDPRVLEPDPSLTAIACIQLALETFGIQVQIFNTVLKIGKEGFLAGSFSNADDPPLCCSIGSLVASTISRTIKEFIDHVL